MHRTAADRRDRVESDVNEWSRRYQRQAAIASLSQMAIGARDVYALLPHAAAVIASTLDVPVVAIGEFVADARRFRIRSGIGTIDQPINAGTSGAEIEALSPRSPLIVNEIREPQQVALLGHVTDVPVESYLMAAVDTDRREWGFILAASPTPRIFKPHHAEFVRAVADVLQLLAKHRQEESLVLAEIEGRFVRIFQASPVALGMSTIDEGRILDVNERWLSFFGFERDEVIGRTNAELGITPPPRRREFSRQARTLGIVRDLEMTVQTKSGEVRDIIASAVPLNAGATEEMWISALVDITARKRAEAERDQLLAREQLARAEAEQALEKLDAVYTITDGGLDEGEQGELLAELLKRLRKTLQVDYATVLLLDDEGKTLYQRAWAGPPDTSPPPAGHMPVTSGLSGQIFAQGRALIATDYSTTDLTGLQGMTPEEAKRIAKSLMGAPFRVRGKIAGVVLATSSQPRQFTGEELKLLTLAADRVAPAIERGRLIAKIRSGLERQRTLSRRLLTAQEEERRRLAVELHDELGQVLTAVKINLESFALANGSTPTAWVHLRGMIQSVDEALLRVRDIALDLRPSVLDDLGLAAAMRWYVDRFARDGRVEAHLSIGVLPPLDPGLKTACFRVAQEALTNVDRHASAHHVWIDLHVLAGALELSIRDDGVGFDVAAARARAIHGESVGLLGMQERVELMSGEYDVVNVAAGGTEVRARFPLAADIPV
jgi:PAS domain S-box-containing protein